MLRILARDVAVGCKRCPAAVEQALVALSLRGESASSTAQVHWNRGFCSADTAPPVSYKHFHKLLLLTECSNQALVSSCDFVAAGFVQCQSEVTGF